MKFLGQLGQRSTQSVGQIYKLTGFLWGYEYAGQVLPCVKVVCIITKAGCLYSPSLCGLLLYSVDSGSKWDNDRRSSFHLFSLSSSSSSALCFFLFSPSFIFFLSFFLFLHVVVVAVAAVAAAAAVVVAVWCLFTLARLVCAVWLTFQPFVSSALIG